jgi:hypothetical protein
MRSQEKLALSIAVPLPSECGTISRHSQIHREIRELAPRARVVRGVGDTRSWPVASTPARKNRLGLGTRT